MLYGAGHVGLFVNSRHRSVINIERKFDRILVNRQNKIHSAAHLLLTVFAIPTLCEKQKDEGKSTRKDEY